MLRVFAGSRCGKGFREICGEILVYAMRGAVKCIDIIQVGERKTKLGLADYILGPPLG